MRSVRNTVAKGFTLVEILIVVVILGILAAIVVPQFTNAANESRVGNVATQVSTIETQLELYAARNNGVYPALSNQASWEVLVEEGYFKAIPRNPFTNGITVTARDAADFVDADGAPITVIYEGIPTNADGWFYDVGTGNIAAHAPASADPNPAP